MSMVKKSFSVLFAFLLTTGFFAVSNANTAGQDEQGMRREQTGQPGRVGQQKEGGFQYDPFFGLLSKLNLTEPQKAQVADILKSNESQAKNVAKEMANAGLQVRKDFMNGTYNADHFNAWVKYEQQGAQLRANIMAAILPKLTQDQQTTLQGLQDQVGSNIALEIDSRFARLDDWIAKHSK